MKFLQKNVCAFVEVRFVYIYLFTNICLYSFCHSEIIYFIHKKIRFFLFFFSSSIYLFVSAEVRVVPGVRAQPVLHLRGLHVPACGVRTRPSHPHPHPPSPPRAHI